MSTTRLRFAAKPSPPAGEATSSKVITLINAKNNLGITVVPAKDTAETFLLFDGPGGRHRKR